MASRNPARAEAAIKDLKEQTGKEAIFLQVELTSLASVKRAAEEFLRYVLAFVYVILLSDMGFYDLQ